MTHVHHRTNGVVISKGIGVSLKALAPLTDGQVYAGDTGAEPVPATITGAGGIVVTPGAGSIAITTRGSVSTTAVGNVGAGEDTLHTWTMPADTVIQHGGLDLHGLVVFAANGNTKTVKFHVGGSSFTLNTATAAPNGTRMSWDLQLWWQSATTTRVTGTIILGTTLEAVVNGALLSTTIDFTAPLVLKYTGEGTDNDDVVQRTSAFRAFRTP